jgi:hypothetical protein
MGRFIKARRKAQGEMRAARAGVEQLKKLNG